MYSHSHQIIEDYDNDWTVREIKKRIVFLNIDNYQLTDWFELIFGSKQQIDATSSESLNKLCVDIKQYVSSG